jgi:hypothetical protein
MTEFKPLLPKKDPVKFIPLDPEKQTPKPAIDRLIETLGQQGVVELRIPDPFEGKLSSLYLIKRQVNNPNGPKPHLPRRSEYTHLPPGFNYDQALSLTLVGTDLDGNPVALGHLDYKIFEVSKTANGDMGLNKKVFHPLDNLPPAIAASVSLSDSLWPGISIDNGIEIAKDFQSAGLAKLLLAAAALVLGRQDIQTIELGSDKTVMEPSIKGIYRSLKGVNHPNQEVLHLAHLNEHKIQEIFQAFLR